MALMRYMRLKKPNQLLRQHLPRQLLRRLLHLPANKTGHCKQSQFVIASKTFSSLRAKRSNLLLTDCFASLAMTGPRNDKAS